MTCFDQFLEPIEIAEKAMVEGYRAYKMDREKDGMRHFVGLGECNCFDYFHLHGNSIALIEETRLKESMQHYRNTHHYLKDMDKDAYADERMREEIRLKAYGSMLVLWRLTEKCLDAKNLFQDKKYCFWIVASDTSAEGMRFFDNLHDDSQSMLKGALSKELVDTVEFLSPEGLRNKLSQQ